MIVRTLPSPDRVRAAGFSPGAGRTFFNAGKQQIYLVFLRSLVTVQTETERESDAKRRGKSGDFDRGSFIVAVFAITGALAATTLRRRLAGRH